jgi:hypothetical protein
MATRHRPRLAGWLAATGLAVWLTGCGGLPGSAPAPTPAPAPAPGGGSSAPAPSPATPSPAGSGPSMATDARSYRRDAASHLYRLNRERIYSGKLPPMLYAVGVMQVELDGRGQVRQFGWLRAPRHAPEVMAEIERTVRRAAPFPTPSRMGKVTYTETWLWDKSGRFQLDTLTEGQRSE